MFTAGALVWVRAEEGEIKVDNLEGQDCHGVREVGRKYVCHTLGDEVPRAVFLPSPCYLFIPHFTDRRASGRSWEWRRVEKRRDKVCTLWIASSCSLSRQSCEWPSPSCMRSIGSLWSRSWKEPWGGEKRRERASSFLVLHLCAATPHNALLYQS